MARPKGDDGGRDDRRDLGDGERPGAYVQVVSTPRRRKSSAKQERVDKERIARQSDSDDTERITRPSERVERTERTRSSPSHYHVDRVSEEAPLREQAFARINVTTGPSRRGPGPLGMNESHERAERSDHAERSLHSDPPLGPVTQSSVRETRPAYDVGSPATHVNVVEINHAPDTDSANTNQRADIVLASSRPPLATTYGSARPAAPHSAAPSVDIGPSVLDARTSLRSDPAARPNGPSWGMVVSVAVLSAIIAAAGVVALQEWLHEASSAPVATAPATAPMAAPASPPVAAPASPPVAAPAPVRAASAKVEAPNLAPPPPAVPIAPAVPPARVAPRPNAPAEPAAAPVAARGQAFAPKLPVASPKPVTAQALAKPRPLAPIPSRAVPNAAPVAASSSAANAPADKAELTGEGSESNVNRVLSGGLIEVPREREPESQEPGADSQPENALPNNPYSDDSNAPPSE